MSCNSCGHELDKYREESWFSHDDLKVWHNLGHPGNFAQWVQS